MVKPIHILIGCILTFQWNQGHVSWVIYRQIQSIRVICCFLFLLAGDIHYLQLITGDVYKAEFMFLTTFILNPNSPGQNIDDCLHMLIDEQKQSWSFGALTYDVSRKHNFQMKTDLTWIINDFSMFEIVSYWSTHEKLAYPYYMKNNKAFTFTNDGKISLFFFISIGGSCQQNISTERKKITFLLAKLKEILYDVVLEYDNIMFDLQSGKQKFFVFG